MTSDLHEQLLARIHDEGGAHCGCAGNALERTIRAVVELHAPVPYFEYTPDWLVCHGCDLDGYEAERPPWPCSTVQAIARELGIEVPS